MRNSFFIIIFIILFHSACTQTKTLEGFDEKAWKEDYFACKNQRSELVKVLMDKKEQLKKFDDDAITELLGAPERNRQFARGKKNYIYFLYPGSQCKKDTGKTEGKKLVIEFDALGKPRIIRESFIDY
jgi:hypothetical protein